MLTSSSLIPAPGPERLMRRVCQHWAHRFPVTLLSQAATVDFGGSQCQFEAREDTLFVALQAPAAELAELEAVVLEHLQRFVPADCTLQADWQHSSP